MPESDISGAHERCVGSGPRLKRAWPPVAPCGADERKGANAKSMHGRKMRCPDR